MAVLEETPLRAARKRAGLTLNCRFCTRNASLRNKNQEVGDGYN
jgi:hypothetical protein